ncbi:uncharacterized protein LOC127812304 isoform X2 [Diospyros lotus]|uniref:uncharacterized protein LOC127812304 isoform X2 n=1 Tax=Diospyros lotus TaxID=55363 RepID=UPI00224ED873|nr:uncharacterized protein LOC127812304 isoform X2 [Diospyros lotus]
MTISEEGEIPATDEPLPRTYAFPTLAFFGEESHWGPSPRRHGIAGAAVGSSRSPLGEAEAEVGSRFDQEAVDAVHRRGRGFFWRAMINPQRPSRRVLNIEESQQGLRPILPEMPPPIQKGYDLGHGRWVRGEPFQIQAGVLDTDTIDTPGVGAHLLYSTILPRDESRYFRNPPEDMNNFEHYLAIGAQGAVAANAVNRARLAAKDAELTD